ncbi:MAG: TRL-like family protein [Spirochaetia bacterium]|nr:TRL-like family protein [Spirochaetia bacterium]
MAEVFDPMYKRLVFTLLISLGISCVAPGGGGAVIFNSFSGPFQATSNAGRGKTGEASAYCMLGLVCFGDCSINKASQEGNLTKVAAVDYHYTSILGFVFNKTTIIVTGE